MLNFVTRKLREPSTRLGIGSLIVVVGNILVTGTVDFTHLIGALQGLGLIATEG